VIKSGFNIPKFFKQNNEQRQSLSVEQVKHLYEFCKSKLEIALLSIAYGCGLRRNEMHKLNTQDIQYKSGILIVVSGKNSKRREVPMSEGVIRDLKEYFINERSQQAQFCILYQ
jgi:integrase/recombinase XerD